MTRDCRIDRNPTVSAPSGFFPQFARLLPLDTDYTVYIPFFDPPYELDDDGNRIIREEVDVRSETSCPAGDVCYPRIKIRQPTSDSGSKRQRSPEGDTNREPSSKRVSPPRV